MTTIQIIDAVSIEAATEILASHMEDLKGDKLPTVNRGWITLGEADINAVETRLKSLNMVPMDRPDFAMKFDHSYWMCGNKMIRVCLGSGIRGGEKQVSFRIMWA